MIEFDNQIRIEKVKVKPRRFSTKWTVETYPHVKWQDLSDEEVEQKFREAFDRWAWETGDPEDRKLADDLEYELDARKNSNFWDVDLEREIAETMAAKMAKKIDEEIMEAFALPKEMMEEKPRIVNAIRRIRVEDGKVIYDAGEED